MKNVKTSDSFDLSHKEKADNRELFKRYISIGFCVVLCFYSGRGLVWNAAHPLFWVSSVSCWSNGADVT